jgi:hypothetical protein
VTVTDISGEEEEYTLDKYGFQLVHHESKSKCKDDGYKDVNLIKSNYFRECERLLKDVTGAVRVFIFDHKVRRGPSNWHKLGPNNSSKRGPLHRVHVDQSYNGAGFLVRRYFPDEADELLKKRWQIINVSNIGQENLKPIHCIEANPQVRPGVQLSLFTKTL